MTRSMAMLKYHAYIWGGGQGGLDPLPPGFKTPTPALNFPVYPLPPGSIPPTPGVNPPYPYPTIGYPILYNDDSFSCLVFGNTIAK